MARLEAIEALQKRRPIPLTDEELEKIKKEEDPFFEKDTDPETILDPDVAVVRIGEKDLVMKKLVYRKFKKLLQLLSNLGKRLSQELDLKNIGEKSPVQFFLENIGILVAESGDEIISFIAEAYEIEKDYLEENLDLPTLLSIIETIIKQNNIDMVVTQAKNIFSLLSGRQKGTTQSEK